MLNRRRSIATCGGILGTVLLSATFGVGALGYKTDPYMKSKRTQLMKARANLFAGDDDKGGHRANAIAYTSAAIDEVTAGMKSNHHHHAQARAGEIFPRTTFAEATGPG